MGISEYQPSPFYPLDISAWEWPPSYLSRSYLDSTCMPLHQLTGKNHRVRTETCSSRPKVHQILRA